MSQYSYYHSETGLFHGETVSANLPYDKALAFARANAPAGHIAIAGHFDPLSQKIDLTSGQVVGHQPPQPSPDHEWNPDSKRWQLNPDAAAALAAHQSALSQILALEAKQPRMDREFNLGYDGARARLQALDDQINLLRAQLAK